MMAPEEFQRLASDPNFSVWVKASAGSGKTKVLIDRMLRLLLAAVPAHRILCLTFTNAAASQMKDRLLARLHHWTTLNESDLIQDLSTLTGTLPTSATLIEARSLSASISESLLKIQTIHSFCYTLLTRFRFESGLRADFSLIESYQASEFFTRAQEALFESPCTPALTVLTTLIPLHRFERLIQSLITKRLTVETLLKPGLETLHTTLSTTLDLPAAEPLDPYEFLAKNAPCPHLSDLQQGVTILSETPSTRQIGQEIHRFLECAPQNIPFYFRAYQALFLTKEGNDQKNSIHRQNYS